MPVLKDDVGGGGPSAGLLIEPRGLAPAGLGAAGGHGHDLLHVHCCCCCCCHAAAAAHCCCCCCCRHAALGLLAGVAGPGHAALWQPAASGVQHHKVLAYTSVLEEVLELAHSDGVVLLNGLNSDCHAVLQHLLAVRLTGPVKDSVQVLERELWQQRALPIGVQLGPEGQVLLQHHHVAAGVGRHGRALLVHHHLALRLEPAVHGVAGAPGQRQPLAVGAGGLLQPHWLVHAHPLLRERHCRGIAKGKGGDDARLRRHKVQEAAAKVIPGAVGGAAKDAVDVADVHLWLEEGHPVLLVHEVPHLGLVHGRLDVKNAEVIAAVRPAHGLQREGLAAVVVRPLHAGRHGAAVPHAAWHLEHQLLPHLVVVALCVNEVLAAAVQVLEAGRQGGVDTPLPRGPLLGGVLPAAVKGKQHHGHAQHGVLTHNDAVLHLAASVGGQQLAVLGVHLGLRQQLPRGLVQVQRRVAASVHGDEAGPHEVHVAVLVLRPPLVKEEVGLRVVELVPGVVVADGAEGRGGGGLHPVGLATQLELPPGTADWHAHCRHLGVPLGGARHLRHGCGHAAAAAAAASRGNAGDHNLGLGGLGEADCGKPLLRGLERGHECLLLVHSLRMARRKVVAVYPAFKMANR